MLNDSGALSGALMALLKEKLPPAEAQSLKDEGFNIKRPTRETVLAIAIYKKAVSGDLSAIKELRNILSGGTEKADSKAVIIIDDIGAKGI
ncbi:MAG: hypothetical protein J5659_05685 [Clostridia bacterium]|nr:hypothetical protein [Clostridia bacterium]